MRKRWILVGMVLLVLGLLSGCGIVQEQYDTVIADLDKAQQETQSVKAELGAAQTRVSELTSSIEQAQSENSELTSSLEEAETELESTQSELGATQEELEELDAGYEEFKSETRRLWILLDGNLALNNAILRTNSGILLDDLHEIEKGCLDITARLATLKDLKAAELNAIWEEAYIVEEGEWHLYYEPFERFMALNSSRITDKAKVLREQLLTE